jgi:soluble cytochrome b562
MQAIQAQKEDVQNSIRTAMSKAELKSANTARMAQALNAIEKPTQPKTPSTEELKTARLQAGYDALVKGYPGATGKQLAAIAYEKYPEIFKEYFSKDYPQADPDESLREYRKDFDKLYMAVLNAQLTKDVPVNEARAAAQAAVDDAMEAAMGPGDYQPPALNLTPPSFPMNDFDINQTPWLKLQEERKRRGGLSYDEYNKSSAVPAGGAKNSSYYKW